MVRTMEPLLKELASKFREVVFVKIDVDELQVSLTTYLQFISYNFHILSVTYQVELRSMPLILTNWLMTNVVRTGCGAGVEGASNANICAGEEREGSG